MSKQEKKEQIAWKTAGHLFRVIDGQLEVHGELPRSVLEELREGDWKALNGAAEHAVHSICKGQSSLSVNLDLSEENLRLTHRSWRSMSHSAWYNAEESIADQVFRLICHMTLLVTETERMRVKRQLDAVKPFLEYADSQGWEQSDAAAVLGIRDIDVSSLRRGAYDLHMSPENWDRIHKKMVDLGVPGPIVGAFEKLHQLFT